MHEKREPSFLFGAVLGIAYTADKYEVIRKNDLRENNRACESIFFVFVLSL